MTATIDLDQLCQLRYWFGPDQVQVLELREGVEGRVEPSSRLTSWPLFARAVEGGERIANHCQGRKQPAPGRRRP